MVYPIENARADDGPGIFYREVSESCVLSRRYADDVDAFCRTLHATSLKVVVFNGNCVGVRGDLTYFLPV